MWRDTQFERDMVRVLKWVPGLDARSIRVSAANGIVTLTGQVVSETARAEAEAAVGRVTGVVAVVNKLTVRYLDAARGLSRITLGAQTSPHLPTTTILATRP